MSSLEQLAVDCCFWGTNNPLQVLLLMLGEEPEQLATLALALAEGCPKKQTLLLLSSLTILLGLEFEGKEVCWSASCI
jgi:hypothetical protein